MSCSPLSKSKFPFPINFPYLSIVENTVTQLYVAIGNMTYETMLASLTTLTTTHLHAQFPGSEVD